MRSHEWRPARIVAVEPSSADMVRVLVEPDEWIAHAPGQHCEIRFPGEELSRKYSIASSPTSAGTFEFGIQVRPRGMLTPRLAAAGSGTPVEVRGPTGRAFAWDPAVRVPLLLLGAGAGVTPLLSIARAITTTGGTSSPAIAADRSDSAHGTYASESTGAVDGTSGSRGGFLRDGNGDARFLFLLSARTPARVYAPDEVGSLAAIRFTSTDGRLDRNSLESALALLERGDGVHVRVCGPLAFMTTMVSHLMELGVNPDHIRSEAFV